MLPGDRIETIRRIASDLGDASRDWEDVELILRQFGFPTMGEGGSSPRAYVMATVEHGADNNLIALDEYLRGGVSAVAPDPSELPWEPGTFRLFISHTSPHAALCDEMRTIFARWRIDAFVAHTTIEPTREWQREIEVALASCQAMTALLTPDLISSAWCDQEVGYCVARKVPIVPVRMGADPHGFIGKYQAARPADPGTGPWIADAIFRALAGHAAIHEAMAAPTVHRFAATTNFDAARANFALLDEVAVDAWTRDLVELAGRAAEANTQLSEAVIVDPEPKALPEALADLLEPVRRQLGMDDAPADAGDDDIPF